VLGRHPVEEIEFSCYSCTSFVCVVYTIVVYRRQVGCFFQLYAPGWGPHEGCSRVLYL